MVFRFAAVVLLAGSLMACANNDVGQKEGFGTVLGGLGGAVAGSAFGSGSGRLVGVAAGTLIGALLGSEIGRSLDRADQAYMARNNQYALERVPSGRTTSWVNPDSGHSGSITPQRTYQTDSGQYCREFQQTVTIGGKSESAYGTACRQPDGSWKVTG